MMMSRYFFSVSMKLVLSTTSFIHPVTWIEYVDLVKDFLLCCFVAMWSFDVEVYFIMKVWMSCKELIS